MAEDLGSGKHYLCFPVTYPLEVPQLELSPTREGRDPAGWIGGGFPKMHEKSGS